MGNSHSEGLEDIAEDALENEGDGMGIMTEAQMNNIKLKNELRSNAKPSLEFLAFILIWLNLLYFR